MAGVRGFSDPNVQVNSGKPVWEQDVNSALTSSASYLLPWYLNYQSGDFLEATQCMVAGDNGWASNHAALNGGLNDHWATNNTPWSWGHYRRSDIPVQFSIADGWTVGDMYQVSAVNSTFQQYTMDLRMRLTKPGIRHCLHQPQSCNVGFRVYQCPWISTNQVSRWLPIY
ncbi:MAG: hypothetical protein CL912_09815 [Deltaproteobacteria bacterium]|nr:hypothetical protein [Deltaproteobacteria bacterium]